MVMGLCVPHLFPAFWFPGIYLKSLIVAQEKGSVV